MCRPTRATLCFHSAILSFKSQSSKLFEKGGPHCALSARISSGFYPLPLSEAQRIRKFLEFPGTSSSAIDPCVGDGAAFEVITNGAEVLSLRY